MRVLDLFCCAGGAGMGYARAGYDVVGIDIAPQPHYPFEFHECNALDLMWFLNEGGHIPGTDYWLDDFDLIHASPPCQLFSVYNNVKSIAAATKDKYLNLIPQTRAVLLDSGKHYVIENVPRAPLHHPVQLCGTSFGIPVRRHRLFETNWPLGHVPCRHGDFTERRFPGSSNRPNGRTVCNVGEYRVPLAIQKECMEVDWKVTLHELSEMVPPVYTEWIGTQFAMLDR